MSNRHRTNCLNSISLNYLTIELGPWKSCHRRNRKGVVCHGTLVPVFAQYQSQGTVYSEYECCKCGKVIRDPQWKIDKDKEREARRNNRTQHKRNYRRSDASNIYRPTNRPIRRNSQ